MTVSAGRAARSEAPAGGASEAKSSGVAVPGTAVTVLGGPTGAPLLPLGNPSANARSSDTTCGALAGRVRRTRSLLGGTLRNSRRISHAKVGSQELNKSGKNNAPSKARSLERRRSKVRQRTAEFCSVTFLARSNRPAPPCAEIRLAREICPESRLLALRAAIAEGRYRIDSQVIAARLIAAIDPHSQSIGQH